MCLWVWVGVKAIVAHCAVFPKNKKRRKIQWEEHGPNQMAEGTFSLAFGILFKAFAMCHRPPLCQRRGRKGRHTHQSGWHYFG
jgi:hypothetical protein